MKDPIERRAWICPHCKGSVQKFSDPELLIIDTCRGCDYEITLEIIAEGENPFEVGCERRVYRSEIPVDFESDPEHPGVLFQIHLFARSKD